jgi:hypothetical protein
MKYFLHMHMHMLMLGARSRQTAPQQIQAGEKQCVNEVSDKLIIAVVEEGSSGHALLGTGAPAGT